MSVFTLPSGRRLAYTLSAAAAAAASRPVVLLSNSICQDYSTWDRVVPVIEGLGYRVLRYDLPGHGGSSAPPSEHERATMTFETLADDVALLLQHLAIPRLHAWIGDSMGGIKGVYFAARHPGVIHKLVVADAIAGSPAALGTPDVFGPRVAAAKAAGSMDQDLVQVGKRWLGDAWMAAHPDETARVQRAMATTTVAGLETVCAALRSPDFDLRKVYLAAGRGCDAALIIVGEKDADLPTRMQAMRASLEESLTAAGKPGPVAMEVIKQAGHVPYVDGFDQFVAVLKKHL
ncbi:3-oxoadipate enol-lactonase [Niveomyces insectorum RCEF 264]|uniref:3-oxoadipate enol-lactonase n=1 Tax=Niveomyces insectorum RCEF 264 TaxID=1081102 RepID=A0A162JCJ2_9HYPO|nr:3-oxoadipate enol-lactonase [Niveomyces insectorum RCEF 264]